MIINSTQVPNIILDYWMPKLSDTSFKILLTITRQTIGYIEDKDSGMRKKEDWISYSQLINKTGRKAPAIVMALRDLEEKKLIEIRDSKGNILETKEERRGKRLFYRLNTKFLNIDETTKKTLVVNHQLLRKAKLEKLSKKTLLRKAKLEKLSKETLVTKENITKETDTKENEEQKKMKTKLANPNGFADKNNNQTDSFLQDNQNSSLQENKSKQVNDLLYCWRFTNFNYEKFLINKTERKAQEELINRYGVKDDCKKLANLIEKLIPKTNKIPYAPRVYKPTQLLDKWNSLIDFMQQRNKSKEIASKESVEAKYPNEDYIIVLNNYKKYRGVGVPVNYIAGYKKIIKKMFIAGYKPKDIVDCMQFFEKYKKIEGNEWMNSWHLGTLEKKIPMFMAKQLYVVRSMEDDYPKI